LGALSLLSLAISYLPAVAGRGSLTKPQMAICVAAVLLALVAIVYVVQFSGYTIWRALTKRRLSAVIPLLLMADALTYWIVGALQMFANSQGPVADKLLLQHVAALTCGSERT
jgi:succinate dehydrogenase hydrophobic anchor subunit